MITARKSPVFAELFALYSRTLFRRRFNALRLAGLEHLQKRDKSVPLVLYANHSAWWDAMMLFEISRAAELDFFVMMEEKNLQELILFRHLGAFSVDRQNARSAVKSIRYAVQILQAKPNRALWIFPQGEIQPNDARPLRLYGGLARIIEQLEKCYAAPVAMRYEFLGDFKPEAFARTGEPEVFERVAAKGLTERLAERLTDVLETVKCDVSIGDFHKYEAVRR